MGSVMVYNLIILFLSDPCLSDQLLARARLLSASTKSGVEDARARAGSWSLFTVDGHDICLM